ncbi:hypothetical protein EJ03DRAFT_272513, partial [Teratosphaeria nubilosa]
LKAGSGLFLIGLYTAVIIGATWTAMTYQQAQSRHHGNRFLPSPANDYLVWESPARNILANRMTSWTAIGTICWSVCEFSIATPASADLVLLDSNTGVPAEWMHNLGRENEGIQMPGGTYFGVMAVFHNLHCLLRYSHRALHPEYYGLDLLAGDEVARHWEHTEHCLNQLKNALMCHGDTTLLTMYWDDKMYQPVANWSSPHECINWDRFMEWVVPNSVDIHLHGELVHPKYGALMKDGKPTSLWHKSFRESGFGKLGNEFLHNRPKDTAR